MFNCHKLLNVNIKTFHKNVHTIFGLSSGYGKCGVAVFRISGSQTLDVLKNVANFKETPKPRYAYLRKLWHPISGDLIDKGLVLWFPGPASFTGEDSCEFQIHGGPALIQAMLNCLSSFKFLKPAKPGEFTKRAFFNGKLDLTEVEGLADLIHSETEAQRKQALLQANGNLSNLYQKWRTSLIRDIAHLEAFIDFSEDQNIEENILESLNQNLLNLKNEIQEHLNDSRKGEILRQGVRAVILGDTNVGKSSFLNIICQRSVSIVTHIEGTTRDIIESFYNINGYPIILADTAGLRNTKDIVEIEGISRAKTYAQLADFIILLVEAEKFVKSFYNEKIFDIKRYKRNYLIELGINLDNFKDVNIMLVVNKIDLLTDEDKQNIIDTENIIYMSCKNNIGVSEAVHQIGLHLKQICGEPTAECPTISHERHRNLLTECLNYLQDYHKNYGLNKNQDFALAAQQLRFSLRCLGQISGYVSTEDILDVIFKDFCIGK